MLVILIFFSSVLFSDELILFKYGESQYPSRLTNRKGKEKIPMDWLFYLYKKGDKIILFDCGTFDLNYIKKFEINNYISPLKLISNSGIDPNSITDLIITHYHFDHAGGIFSFPEANLHIHPDEYKKLKSIYTSESERKYFKNMEIKNKVLFYKDNSDLYENIVIVPTGGHTQGSISIEVHNPDIHWVFTGDECYYESECMGGVGTFPSALYAPIYNIKYMKYLMNKDKKKKIFTFHDPEMKNFFQMDSKMNFGRILISTN